MLIWQDTSRFNKNYTAACYASGINRKSKNKKTGPMIQLYFQAKEKSPLTINKLHKDDNKHPVCKDCPLISRGCYVNLLTAPSQIQKTIQKSEINSIDDFLSRIKDKPVRFGAYGEPVLLPLNLFKKITNNRLYTGYTHQWKRKWAQPYQKYLMASVENNNDKDHANRLGWRTFRIVQNLSEKLPDEIICPASQEYKVKTNKVVTCSQCGICSGTNSKIKKNVVIVGHGGKIVKSSLNKYIWNKKNVIQK